MDAVRVITGAAVPLVRSDVDTDQIIPSDWLKRVERTGFGEGLFSEWRENSDFVLNQERYDGREDPRRRSELRHRLVTRARGVGAAWTTASRPSCRRASPTSSATTAGRWGSSPRPSRRSRCSGSWDAIEEDPNLELVIDVEHKRVAVPAIGLDVPFEIDDFTQHRLLEGLDDIGLTLAHGDGSPRYESTAPAWMPTVQA